VIREPDLKVIAQAGVRPAARSQPLLAHGETSLPLCFCQSAL
jgi:hypothetical protein